MSTIREVARLAGVSIATASRALTNPDKVTEATRRKGATFEGGMRVSFIAYWQGHFVPTTSSVPVIGTDILPTVLDYRSRRITRSMASACEDLLKAQIRCRHVRYIIFPAKN